MRVEGLIAGSLMVRRWVVRRAVRGYVREGLWINSLIDKR